MGALDGKVGLVTGASRGIGESISYRLASEGAELYLLGRDYESLRLVKNKINKENGKASEIVCDIRSDKSVRESLYGLSSLDIVVNNAGIAGPYVPLNEVDEKEILDVFETNVFGAMRIVRNARLFEGGSIINISSILGYLGAKNMAPYCASKAALDGLTRALSIEFAPRSIRVNSIQPTMTETEMTKKIFSDNPMLADQIVTEHPFGYLPKKKDIADLVKFLASDESRCISGQTIKIDCGRSIDGK